MQPPSPESITLSDILITEALSQRSPCTPNWQAEAKAMQPLVQQMARGSDNLLETLVNIALDLCHAGTTGVSLLETTPTGEEIFRWVAIAGTLVQHVGGFTPRHFSPCGVCLDRGTPQLFSHPERYFSYLQDANTPIVEGLVLPLICEYQALGTLWIISHNEQRQFDVEDVRVMMNLANFSAAALLLNQQQTGELLATNVRLEAEIAERKQTEAQLSETQKRLELSLAGADLGTWTYNIGTDEFWADDRALQMHGHAPGEVQTFADAGIHIHPEDRDRAQAALAQVIQSRSKLQMEYRVIWRNNSVHWIVSHAEFVPGDQGDGMFYGVVQDITPAKHLEAGHKRVEETLAADLQDTKLLHDLSARLVTEDNIQTLYQEIMAAAIALTRADAGTVQILEVATQDLLLLATQGFESNVTEHFYRVNANSNTSCGIALATGERTFIDFNVPQSGNQSDDPDGSMRIHVEAGYLSAQSTPLVTRTGKPIGMVSTHWSKKHRPSERELQFLDLLARQAADLIEQRQAEVVLLDSEEKYRSLFETIENGFCLVQVLFDANETAYDYRFLEVNRAFETQSGLSDAVGKTILELVPNLEPQWAERYGQVAKSGNAVRFEADVPSMNRIFDIYAFPSGASGENVVAVLFTDISARKRQEQHRVMLAEISQDLVGLEHVAKTMDLLGEKIGQYFGVKQCVFTELTEDLETAVAAYGWKAAGAPSVKGTYRMRDFLTDEQIAANKAGIVSIVNDTQNDPRVNAERYGALDIRSFVIVPLMRNNVWQFMISIINNQPRHWREDEIDLMREMANRIWTRLERARAEAALREVEIQRIQEQSARDQEYQRAETLAELDRAKTQFFSNISHEFRTPLTLILDPLAEALASLEEKPQAQFGITSDATQHLHKQIQTAQRNGLRLLKLVNNLLDFSRVEADRLQAHYEPTDLSTYTADLASVFRSTIESAGLQLVVDCPPLPEPIYVDRNMWEKIVLNLLSNAFKFTFAGTIAVSLSATENQVALTIGDTGTGIPAHELPHLFERFYQVKGAQGRSYEGSGIGLSVVQELVKRHGGTIRVASEVNQGTRFTVTLPTGMSHLPADQISQLSSGSPTTNGIDYYIAEATLWLPETEDSAPIVDFELNEGISSTGHFRTDASLPSESSQSTILIVDDNADMRDYLCRLLHQHYQVKAVNNGRAALETIQQQKPDLVLADVMMPKIDGLQLLRALRQNEQTKDIPIILLSARAGEAAQIEGLTAGADDYLTKPFSSRELLARIDAHLKLATMRREVAIQTQIVQTVQTLNEQLEQRVEERTAQLQALNQELEAFSYSVSHDLRVPLRYISSFAEQLRKQLEAAPSNNDTSPLRTLNIITRSALSAEKMVDNLLTFSRVGQSEMRNTLVPLSLLVWQVQAQLQSELEGRVIHWQVAPLSTVRGDPTLLQLVLQNLLANAVKYTRERNPAEITIDSWETEKEVIVAVKDNGAGFDMKYSDRLFKLFQRLHTQEAFAGTGVGLANVRRIIHRHGGQTWAEGKLDQGATFYFTLPKEEKQS